MSDEEAYPPLPPSPTRERKSSSESGGSHDSELANIPPPVGRDVLDEIPYPTLPAVGEMDIDVEIPLPADSSSRYSPSHVLGTEEEEEILSPSDRKKSVLGKAQAKKRLLAFSAAKAAAAAAAAIVSPSSTTTTVNSAMKKPSPLKTVGQKQKAEPVLAIHSIKEEETQLKKMLAMNSLLADKLHQVKMIATNVPALPSLSSSVAMPANLTAVVKPLVNPSLALSESTVDSSSKDERRRSSKKSKRRHHSSQSPDSSKARSPRTDEKKSKKRSKKSKSRSPSKDSSSRKSKKTLRRSRSRSGSGSIKKREEKTRRSKTPSPCPSYVTKKKTHGGNRMSPPPPPKARKEERLGEKDEGRHSSKTEHSRDRERHGSGSSKSSRGGHEESEREREREQGKAKGPILPTRQERNKKYDKVRQSQMPADWTDYKKHEYESSDINLLWSDLRSKDAGEKSGSRSSSCSPIRSTLEQPTKLSRTLAIPAGERQTILLANGEVGDYPAHLIKWTKEFPRISYGFNPYSSRGFYKTRQEIYKSEESLILGGMTELINLGPSTHTYPFGVMERRDWWAVSEQVFCPSQGSKGILISHLYSDDEESKSPFPVTKDEVLEQVQAKLTSDEGSEDEDVVSIDSAPSPLLKRKYDKVDEDVSDEPPSPLLHKPLQPIPLIKEEPPKPKVPIPTPTPTTDEENPVEQKHKKKKPKKEKKVKRGLRKKELTTTSDEEEDEEKNEGEGHKRKKGKKKNRKRGKSSSDEDEEERSHKGKKKKAKKEKKKKRDKSPPSSSDEDEDGSRRPSGGGGGGGGGGGIGGSSGTGRGYESRRDRDRDEDRRREKTSRGEKKEERMHGGGSSGGRRRNFLINPADFEDVDMSEEGELIVAAQWEAEEAEALKEVRTEEAVKLESEAQMIISDLQDDHIFQMLLQDDLCSATFGDIFPFPEDSNTKDSTPLQGNIIEEVKEEKVREKIKEKKEKKEKKVKEKEKKEKGNESKMNEKSSRRREYSDEEEVQSSRHHHRRHRHGYGDGHGHSHGKRSEERSKSRSSKTKSMKLKTSPPLQLNVADSTISDADLLETSPHSMVPLQPLPCGPGFIGGISKDILLDVSANHFHPNNFNSNHASETQELLDGNLQSQGKRKGTGFMSPPRRLSLDERLEMEMGIKLREEVPKAVPMPPYYAQWQPSFYPTHELYPYPPLNHFNLQQIYHMGQAEPPWQHQPPPFGAPLIPPFTRPPPRPQSQIIQVGNMIQVVPAEIPTAPITITCTTSTLEEQQNYDTRQKYHGQQEMGRKRVVTIKVPVVPFSVPMVEPVNGPTQAEIDEQRLRRKRRAQRRKRLEQRKAAEAKESTKVIGEDKVKDGSGMEEEVSAEELALLKEAISEVPNFETETSGEEELAKDVSGSEVVEENEGVEGMSEEIEEREEEVLVESVDVEEEFVETPILPLRILPPPEVGILIPFGLRERKGEKKCVKFADGIHPGCGSPPTETAEELSSPPPPAPAFYPYKKSFTKERNGASKKKKIKVKVMRTTKGEKVKVDENAEPPPCPSMRYPFCPIGILYQVCPQYAVLYAQSMAEKGYDIIFEPSTQQPCIGREIQSTSEATGWLTSNQSSLVSKIPTIMNLSREEPRQDVLDLDEIELPRSPILDDIPLPSDNPNLLVISPTKIPMPMGTPPPPVSTLDDIPLPTDRRKRRRRHGDGERKAGGSISIPLSRIAAEKRTIGVLGYERSKGTTLPQQHPQPLYDFDYDFTPLSLPPSSVGSQPSGGPMRMDLCPKPSSFTPTPGKDFGEGAELELAR